MNVISTDMDITSEMKNDAETKAKEFLGHTEINDADHRITHIINYFLFMFITFIFIIFIFHFVSFIPKINLYDLWICLYFWFINIP